MRTDEQEMSMQDRSLPLTENVHASADYSAYKDEPCFYVVPGQT